MQTLKKQGKIIPCAYRRLHQLGYKLISTGRGVYYKPRSIDQPVTDKEKRMDYEELRSDPSDRLTMYVQYTSVREFKLYICKLKFGREDSVYEPFTLEILRG